MECARQQNLSFMYQQLLSFIICDSCWEINSGFEINLQLTCPFPSRRAFMFVGAKALHKGKGNRVTSLMSVEPVKVLSSCLTDLFFLSFTLLEKIPCEGEFIFRRDLCAGLIASCGSFYLMVPVSCPDHEI